MKIFFLGRLCREFLSELSCLAVPKIFLKETFCDLFQKIPVTQKRLMRGGGEEEDFPLKNCSSNSSEKFHRGTLLCFTKILASMKEAFYG